MSGPEKNIMLYGGSRSGKTFIIVYAIIVRACLEKSRHVMLRKTFNSIKTSIWLDTLKKVLSIAFPDLDYEMNKTDYYITLPNGSEIWIAGLDDDKRVEKILGKEFSTIFFNECSQISYESVQIAMTRLAEKNGLRKKAFFDENPPSKRHWSYWQFMKGIDPIDSVPIDRSNYAHILMNPDGNIENIDEEYLELLSKMPEREKNRFLLGLFAEDDDGQAYYSFSRDNHVMEIPKQIGGSSLIGMDFNVNPMTAVICYSSNDVIHVWDEVYLENSDTFKMCNELTLKNVKGARVFPDSTGRNRKTSGTSDFEILKSKGFSIEHTRNPLVVDRVNNINRLLQEKRIVIHPRCRKLIADLERVSWKNNELDKKSDQSLTHISDALGYVCWAIDPLREKQPKPETYQL